MKLLFMTYTTVLVSYINKDWALRLFKFYCDVLSPIAPEGNPK